MITLTAELKSRSFKEYEKRRLFNVLRKPLKDRQDEVADMFKKWLEENVMPRVLDQDFVELGKKPYCIRTTNRFTISPTELGLDEVYIGNPNYSNLKTSLKFEFLSNAYKYATDGKNFSIDITSGIKTCTSDIIEQVKYFLYEQAKAKYDYTFYGVGTFVVPEYWGCSYGVFRDIRTWGNLWSKSPEMFEQLYKITEGKELKENHETLDPEKKLLSELKISLGY